MKNITIIVEIKGGFGNQLFQFAFANSLKDRGYTVKVKTNFYDQFKEKDFKDTYRSLIIPEQLFNLEKTGKLFNLFIRFNQKISDSKNLKRLFNNFQNPIFSKLKDSNYSDELLNKRFVHLDGYWQNMDTLTLQKKFLIESISNIPEIKKSIETPIDDNSIMMLVRRGDYVGNGEDLNLDFYKTSIEFLSMNIDNLKINIFTDDVDWVVNQEFFSIADNIFGPEEEPTKVIKLFSKMISHRHFVVGNSTFSLLAAFIGELNDSFVLVANPWFKNKKHVNLIKENWIKISNV